MATMRATLCVSHQVGPIMIGLIVQGANRSLIKNQQLNTHIFYFFAKL